MSNTRHANTDGGSLRQERFCSSPELNHGLMANLVAKRCSVLDDPKDRELIYFVQYLSHERGLEALADELIELHPREIATKAMQGFGLNRHYNAEQLRAVRREIPAAHDFLLAGDRAARLRKEAEQANRLRAMYEGREYEAPRPVPLPFHVRKLIEEEMASSSDAEEGPSSIPAEKFWNCCRSAASELPDYLADLCLKPALPMQGPWYFPTLIERLREYMEAWQAERAARIVSTEVSRKVIETIEYSLNMQCLALAEGIEGTGKTWAAENFCLQRPGRMRYVQVPSTDDEAGFYREIAKALGVSINLNSKARELRERIEDVLQAGDLAIVFDEAHWLFGINSTRGGLPKRMLWVITALVNKHVPVTFIATPQWEANKKFVKQHTRWRDGQLTGRIDHHEKLPEVLSKEELTAVVQAKLPAADAKAVATIVHFARVSERCLGTLSAVVKRALFLAQKNGRSEPSRADINAVILEKGFNAQPPAPAAPSLPARGSDPAMQLPPARRSEVEVA